jgi:hypothetical protein
MLNGDGTFLWKDGKMYVGNFVNSAMDGLGTVFYHTNQVVEGKWLKNRSQHIERVRNDGIASAKIRETKERHEGVLRE